MIIKHFVRPKTKIKIKVWMKIDQSYFCRNYFYVVQSLWCTWNDILINFSKYYDGISLVFCTSHSLRYGKSIKIFWDIRFLKLIKKSLHQTKDGVHFLKQLAYCNFKSMTCQQIFDFVHQIFVNFFSSKIKILCKQNSWIWLL